MAGTGVGETVARLRATSGSGVTRPLEWRLERLADLRSALLDREQEIFDALAFDLGKPAPESLVTELGLVVAEIDHVRHHLAGWMRPTRVRVPLVQWPGRASVSREPLGIVLVVAPWNFPVYLTLMATVSALAAGNCVLAKPSELAPATSAALARLLGDGSAASGTAAVLGGPDVVHEVLEAGVDHVFFTGSTRIGRLVAEAAGRHLTPVTLELGGKCPAVVDESADLRIAARRIAWAKYVNAGQSCVAPDYVLVHRKVAPALVDELVLAVRSMYGSNPRHNDDYARLIDGSAHDRLTGLLAAHGGKLVLGGEHERGERYLAPTIVLDPAPSSALMSEEIFGPILPVVTVDDVERALGIVRSKPDPLAVYVFAERAEVVDVLRSRTRSGSFCVNAAMSQLGVDDLPFGGVGASGSGLSHGRWGFERFVQMRAMFSRRTWPDIALHTPPYSAARSWLVRRALGVPEGSSAARRRRR
ncbi:MAG: aldehyde dehydrogenase [Acidimicrobiaceae bacterium]|nr:aldehyde dehydrogenase [Acidimicrobiaceae bacterium]